jgi:O6-methylguanine-DNA--protein-cysteine methyltransferase
MTEINSELLKYIAECREKGFEDYEIRIPLLENGWQLDEIQEAFDEIRKEEDKKLKVKQVKDNKTIYVYKNSMTIHLGTEVYGTIAKRAKKNMLTPEEQVEDIIRRSCVNTKKNETADNVDDIFLKLFSRKNSGRPKKK